jgi:general secretion pathway protein M
MKKLMLYLNSLELRERIVFILGLYAVIIIVGVFMVTDANIKRIEKVDDRISKEIQNYNQLVKLASEYISFKPRYKKVDISLSFIETLARKKGIKENITSLKPYQQGSVEISFEKVDGIRLTEFIKAVKEKNLKIMAFSMEDPRGNGELNVRMVISE